MSENLKTQGFIIPKIVISPESKMAETEKGEPEKEKWIGFGKPLPVPKIEDYAEFDTWCKCVTAWSKTCHIPKEQQGFF